MVKSVPKALLISAFTTCIVSLPSVCIHNIFVEGKLRGITTTIENRNENDEVRKLDVLNDIDFDLDVPDIGDRRELKHYENDIYNFDYNGRYFGNRYVPRSRNRKKNRYHKNGKNKLSKKDHKKYKTRNNHYYWPYDIRSEWDEHKSNNDFRLWSNKDDDKNAIDEQELLVDHVEHVDSSSSSSTSTSKRAKEDMNSVDKAAHGIIEYADEEIPLDIAQQEKEEVLKEEKQKELNENGVQDESAEEGEESIVDEDNENNEIIELTDQEGRRLWGRFKGRRGRGRGRKFWGRGWRALSEEDYSDLEIIDMTEDKVNEEFDARRQLWGRWIRPRRRRGFGWRRNLGENQG